MSPTTASSASPGRVLRLGSAVALTAVLGLIAPATAAAAPPAPPAPPAPAATDGRQVEGAGQHVDALYPVMENGKFTLRTETPQGVTDPEKVVLHVPETPSSKVDLPAGYEFLAPAGSPAWITSQTQNPDVVWPGWSTEGIGKKDINGTVAFDLDGFAYAGPSKNPRFAVTGAGGLTGEKTSRLFVPGSLFTEKKLEPGGHEHANWVFTAPGTYDISFTAKAKLPDGKPVSDKATVRFVVGPTEGASGATKPVATPAAHKQTKGVGLTPDKVDGEYFVGQSIIVNAAGTAVPDNAKLRWYLKRTVDPDFVVQPEETAAEYEDKPDRDLDGAQLYAEVLGPNGAPTAKSEPLTLRVAAKPPSTTMTVTPDKPAYRPGETATIASAQNPQTPDEHYHWYLRKRGENKFTWIPESRDVEQKLPITPDMDGAEVTVKLFNADHASLAESAPATLHLEGAPPPEVTVSGGDDTYDTGDTLTATANSATPPPGGWAWSVRKASETPFAPIPGANGPELSTPVAADWGGAEIRAQALDAAGKPTGEATVPFVKTADSNPDQASAGGSTGTVVAVVVGVLVVAAAVAAAVLLRRRRS
ncbi:choice-of-anchor M domain-containing protein [Pseudonocardia phyllosphaerae]|uniref:choice-of-anchor M domain-containing protein n=1 Tax=Pseudonocardia phyllosphaerae TaxID=3390502 RepID=UPI003978EB21